MTTKRFQRRTILVKQSFQLRFMAMVFCAALAAALIVGLGVYYTLARPVLLDNPFLHPVLARAHHKVLVQITLYFGIIAIVSAYVSHRIAGPIYRFEQSARALAKGELTHRIRLREGDELRDLEGAMNELAANLQTMVQKDRHLARRIQAKLETLERKADGAAAAELRELREEVGHLTKEFKI